MRTRRAGALRSALLIPTMAAGAAMAALGTGGCGGDPILRPVLHDRGPSMPLANTPTGTLLQLEWSYNKRDTLAHEGLFTADYRFVFAPDDSAGNAYPNRELTRNHELRFARAMFISGTHRNPPPVAIQLQVGPTPIVLRDDRPGKDPSVHRQILANLLLRAEQPDVVVSQVELFFVVRGDSAAWPAGIAHARADSTHWFIEGWEEQSYQGPSSFVIATSDMGGRRHAPLQTLPSGSTTFGKLKALYLE